MQNLESTILSQYANSPAIIALINNMNTYLDPITDIDNFYNNVWNINTAIGHGLDVWGRIVGVQRNLQISTTNYFGMTGPSGASGVEFNQGPFYNGEAITSNFALSDTAFRALIFAKALANICNATIPAINQILKNLWGPSGFYPLAGNSYCTDGQGIATASSSGTVMTVSAVQSGTLAVNQIIGSPSVTVPLNTTIASLGTGSGGAGTYNLSNAQTFSSQIITFGLPMTMTYTFSSVLDPVTSAIVFQSGVLPRPAGVSATVVHP